MGSQTVRTHVPLPDNAPLDDIEQAHGYIDRNTFSPNEVVIGGWMWHPNKEMDSLRLYLNGAFAGPVTLQVRTDVGHVFPSIPHAAQSGFQVHLDASQLGALQRGRVDLVGYQGEQAIARLSTLYRTDLDSVVPTPPPELMHRVARTRDSKFFKVWGLKCYGDFLEVFRRHSPFDRRCRLLDWGCGCGPGSPFSDGAQRP